MVKDLAIFYGTPSSSSAKFESGLMTLLAEKSTLFPIKCCLNRPYFPFSLSSMLFIDFMTFFFLPPATVFYIAILSSFTIIDATALSIY
jgi:hypothetical protein